MELAANEFRSSVNDIELIARVVAGDAAAERELYETYVDRIFRLTFRLAGDDELARDFTQATFIRAFEKIGSFRGESSLSTWLHSIGVSVALNGLRKTRRMKTREAPTAIPARKSRRIPYRLLRLKLEGRKFGVVV